MNTPIDLDRERELRSIDRQMRKAVENVDPTRTANYLTSARRMPDQPSSIRLPAEIHKRLARLAKKMSKDPQLQALAGSKVSASQAHRMALQVGLDELEARYGLK